VGYKPNKDGTSERRVVLWSMHAAVRVVPGPSRNRAPLIFTWTSCRGHLHEIIAAGTNPPVRTPERPTTAPCNEAAFLPCRQRPIRHHSRPAGLPPKIPDPAPGRRAGSVARDTMQRLEAIWMDGSHAPSTRGTVRSCFLVTTHHQPKKSSPAT
jgi:hypothetical protein